MDSLAISARRKMPFFIRKKKKYISLLNLRRQILLYSTVNILFLQDPKYDYKYDYDYDYDYKYDYDYDCE